MKKVEKPQTSTAIDLRGVLFVLAAEILTAKNMPGQFLYNWEFCKTTPLKDRIKVIIAGRKAHDQCSEWANKLAAIASCLPDSLLRTTTQKH